MDISNLFMIFNPMIIIIIIYISEFLHEDILQPLNKVWANLKRNC